MSDLITEMNLVEVFSGRCHACGGYVDGRRHNATWNPFLGLAHASCSRR